MQVVFLFCKVPFFSFSDKIIYMTTNKESQTCNHLCEANEAVCSPSNHGLTNRSVLDIFRGVGVNCKTGFKQSDLYSIYKKTYYIAGLGNWHGRCVGWAAIPSTIRCNVAPSSGTIMLCPCKLRGKSINQSIDQTNKQSNKQTNKQSVNQSIKQAFNR